MAEPNGHDVVNQSLSGGDPSPSDVPASTTDKQPAGGDVVGKHTATSTGQSEINGILQDSDGKEAMSGSNIDQRGVEDGSGSASTVSCAQASRHGVYSELNIRQGRI